MQRLTALECAVRGGSVDCVLALLEAGVPPPRVKERMRFGGEPDDSDEEVEDEARPPVPRPELETRFACRAEGGPWLCCSRPLSESRSTPRTTAAACG